MIGPDYDLWFSTLNKHNTWKYFIFFCWQWECWSLCIMLKSILLFYLIFCQIIIIVYQGVVVSFHRQKWIEICFSIWVERCLFQLYRFGHLALIYSSCEVLPSWEIIVNRTWSFLMSVTYDPIAFYFWIFLLIWHVM